MLELFQFEFMRNAFYAALLASVACGVIGSYVVVKRIVFISGGIAHTAFGGIGLGYFLGINPLIGVIPFSLAAAVGIGIVSKRTRLAEDTSIGILWAMGMAVGVLFISLTPGYAPDLFGYLFGSILTVPGHDLALIAGLDCVIIAAVGLLYKGLLAVSFDEEFARISGNNVEVMYSIMLCLVALTVIVLIKVVGIILVIALLTIPASIAQQYTVSLPRMMLLSAGNGMILTTGGLIIAYYADIPSGATIILLSGAVMGLSAVIQALRKRQVRAGRT